jgi:signal transduction histidine kinase/ActR/RegA family two-component response regulator
VRVKTSDIPVAKLRRLFLHRSVPFVLFAVGCGLSLAASWYLSAKATETVELRTRAEFVADAQQTRRQIQSGLNSYIEVVRAAAVLLSTDTEINGSEFRRFVNRLELPERYPGLDGIGFAQCMRASEVSRVMRSYDLDGNRFRVWPQTERTERCPVVFLEPTLARNRAMRGFDLATDDRLRDAMHTARDTGQPAVSRKLGEAATTTIGADANVFVFIPVYRVAGVGDTTLAFRRRTLVGFVFSPFNSERLIEHIVELTVPSLAFEVFDSPEKTEHAALGGSRTPAQAVRYESSEHVDVTGREWLVSVKFLGPAATIAPPEAQQALFGGLMLSFMLFLVTRAQARAWETAARHEAELRASAEALKEREAQANAANRAKDEFLATLSHELRTPLNVVLGWVGMLRHGALSQDRVPRALEIVERNARQQAELIDDLLDVSRIITGKLRLNLRTLELAPIVSTVVESLRPSAEAKGVALHVSFAASSTVQGDPDRLRQTMWNLLSNAVKFTPAGGVVTVELVTAGERVRLVVRDTGVGIASEFLPHVFERFMQADSTTTRAHSGVGLGLAIVRELIELHGGTVQATSPGVGKGATFTISLPAAAAPTQSARTPHATSNVAPQLDGVRVLVVDDDPNTLEMLSEALRVNGALVTAADSARRALERLDESRADVIISDIAMPGEDGFWLMQRIRALPGKQGRTPAVALTALARSEDRARAIKAGFQMHMAKPVRLDDLQAVVAELAAEAANTHAWA